MSETSTDRPSVAAENPEPPPIPGPEELEGMTQAELARLAGRLDDVDVVHNARKWPLSGTQAEKRAEKAVALWFTLAALSGACFIAVFVAYPATYVAPGQPGYLRYALFTPIIGFTFGFAVLALGIGVMLYVKTFFPDEVSVQQRHDGASDELARKTVLAQLAAAGKDTTIARRTVIKRSAGAAAGLFGLALGVGAIAPFVKNPWAGGDNAALWVTPWRSTNGETVFLNGGTGDPTDIALVRPEDMAPGSMQTVFPFRQSDRGDEEALLSVHTAADTPVMLIRVRPGTSVVKRAGQENFNYGDYYAFSKVCTHLGCDASLYEAQTNISLCPCHQSQFLITEYARPIFGPATRALPQLPITVNDEGYFVARSDFVEPVGPAFWELNGK